MPHRTSDPGAERAPWYLVIGVILFLMAALGLLTVQSGAIDILNNSGLLRY